MSEDAWILHKCSRPKGYGTLYNNSGSVSNQQYVNYTVKPSDSITSIAVKHDISVGQLRQFNRISLSNVPIPGTVLRIPLPNAKFSNRNQSQSSSGSSNTGNSEQHTQSLIDPIVDTITSSSRSFNPDRSNDLPERL